MNKPFFLLTFLLLFGLAGCEYDNKEDLLTEMTPTNGGTNPPPPPPPPVCDTSSISYSAFIQPLLNATCTACHRQGSANAGVRLDAYDFVLAVARSGQLVGVLRGEGFPQMPPSGPIDDCAIDQIAAWVDAGAAQN